MRKIAKSIMEPKISVFRPIHKFFESNSTFSGISDRISGILRLAGKDASKYMRSGERAVPKNKPVISLTSLVLALNPSVWVKESIIKGRIMMDEVKRSGGPRDRLLRNDNSR